MSRSSVNCPDYRSALTIVLILTVFIQTQSINLYNREDMVLN